MDRRKPTNIDGGVAVGRGFQPRSRDNTVHPGVNTLCQEVEGYLLQSHRAYHNTPPSHELSTTTLTPNNSSLTHDHNSTHSNSSHPPSKPQPHPEQIETATALSTPSRTDTALSHNSTQPQPTRKYRSPTTSKTIETHPRTELDTPPESAVHITTSLSKLVH